MGRLIDADALMEELEAWAEEADRRNANINYAFATAIIAHVKSVPTIEERKTGKWINNIHDIPICDQCGYMTPYDRAIDDYEYGNYCPNCGADMREQP